MTDEQLEERPYEVGYGKPPLHTRFQPGVSGNPGGKPRGASVLAAILRDLAAEPDGDGIGLKARQVAEALIAVSTGKRDPSEVDTKAALAILDRTDGPLVKERVNTNIEVLQDVELRDRRERPAPGTETKT